MRHVELVAFENDSILHQKALSLPVGKVSLRQLGILVVGILTVFSAYAITDNIIVSGILFAVFLGIGLPNTKIMTPDQMIKSVILFLVRGTSLSKKSEYMQKNKKTLKSNSKEQTDNQNNVIQRSETQSHDNMMFKIISQLESLYKKKESTESKQNVISSNNDKTYSVKIELTPENMLNITTIKTIKNKSQENNSIDKLLNSLTSSKNNPHVGQKDSNFLQEHISILLDNKKLEPDKIIISKNNSVSVLLDKNSNYKIETIAD